MIREGLRDEFEGYLVTGQCINPKLGKVRIYFTIETMKSKKQTFENGYVGNGNQFLG